MIRHFDINTFKEILVVGYVFGIGKVQLDDGREVFPEDLPKTLIQMESDDYDKMKMMEKEAEDEYLLTIRKYNGESD
jgi:hypothetical protein